MATKKYPKYTINLGKTPEGKRITKTFYGKTKKEAKQKAEAYRSAGTVSVGTLNTVAKQFLATNTDETKAYRIKAFTESLGSWEIGKINCADIETVLAKLASEGKRERTVSRYLQSLNQVFKYAQRNRLISFNPCEFVRLPNCSPSLERNALKTEEIALLEQSLTPGTLAALIMVYCGLRRGELAALTWEDIDLENGTLTVNKSWDYKNNRLKGTKSKAGNRIVPIPKNLSNRLKTAQKGKRKTSLVIVNEIGERMNEWNWQNWNRQLCSATGLKFTWHCLRHTYATILYDADIGVKEAQHLLGHSSVEITMDIYTHLSEQKKTTSADKLNRFIADNLQTKSS